MGRRFDGLGPNSQTVASSVGVTNGATFKVLEPGHGGTLVNNAWVNVAGGESPLLELTNYGLGASIAGPGSYRHANAGRAARLQTGPFYVPSPTALNVITSPAAADVDFSATITPWTGSQHNRFASALSYPYVATSAGGVVNIRTDNGIAADQRLLLRHVCMSRVGAGGGICRLTAGGVTLLHVSDFNQLLVSTGPMVIDAGDALLFDCTGALDSGSILMQIESF